MLYPLYYHCKSQQTNFFTCIKSLFQRYCIIHHFCPYFIGYQIIEIKHRIQNYRMFQQSDNLIPKHAHGLPLSLFLPDLNRIDSPHLLEHFSSVKPQEYPSLSFKTQQINLEQLLSSNHGPSIKKVSDNRQKYRQIKQKISNCMATLNSKKSLSLSQVVQWKQTILSTFLNQVLVEIGKQCKEKSQILVYIWNTAFNIIDYLFETVTRMSERDEKKYLEALLSNHSSYQTIIENIQAKLAKKEEERKQQEEFIKALVYNLRYKRKEIKKLAKNLRLCTVRLNQFKDFYLDLQLEHIELLSQNRDISKENALNLLKRKQEINHQKRKQYKLKQSHKRIRFQIQNEIQKQNQNQQENVNKLNEELHSAFNKYYFQSKQTKSKQNLQTVAQNLFQNALDDFNVRIDDIPQTETIIDFKNNIAFMDAATDMTDFERDVEEREVQMTFNDRLMEDMIMHAAVQTVDIKPKAKIYEENGVQAQEIELKSMKLNRVRVIDRSYLLEDYRQKDRRFKLQKKPTQKTTTEQHLKSMKEIHYYDNNKKTVQLIDYQLAQYQNQKSVQVQTQNTCIINFTHLSGKFRNTQFEREVYRYLQRAKGLSINTDFQQSAEDTMSRTSLKTKNILKRSLRKNNLSGTLQDSNELREKSLPGSFYNSERKSKQSTARINFKQLNRQSKDTIMRKKPINVSQSIWQIKQSRFQEMQSKAKAQQDQLLPTLGKFIINRKQEPQQVSKEKGRFLNNLNLSDKLMSKVVSHFQFTAQNRKLLSELQKLSEELSSNKNLFELLQSNINQNLHILKEQLRKMLNKKRNNRRLAVSRQKSLTKIISLVYTYAYHLYFNHDKPLISLIVPLFHYFKIGYGEIKKNDLYLRMLYFLSQTICHQQEYYIFETFILFLGLNLDENKLTIGRQNTCMFLRLLSALSVNFKFPLNVQQLYTTSGQLDSKCREILLLQHYEPTVIEKVVERVKVKLQSLINEGQNPAPIDSAQYGEIKINVFKCCRFIIEQLQKIKSVVYDSYTHIYDYFLSVQGLAKEKFHEYIIRNLYVGRAQKHHKMTILDSALKAGKQQGESVTNERYLYKIIGVFLQLNIIDFNKIYFMALSKYRIKQEFLYLSINRRYPFLNKYLQTHQPQFAIQRSLILHLTKEQKNMNKEMVNKKVIGLAYLQIVENETNRLLCDVLGGDLWELYLVQY